MITKHTSGPWISDGAQIFIETDDGRQQSIGQANGFRISQETVYANARLISAAPDLLEALRNLLEVCSETDNTRPAIAAARAAIAKATEGQ